MSFEIRHDDDLEPEPCLSDIAPNLNDHLASIVPWFHPAMLTITTNDWLVERRVAVLQAATRILVTEFIDNEVAPPNDGIEALGKYVVEAAKELLKNYKGAELESALEAECAKGTIYKIPDHVLVTTDA